jgi:hypothetical protein
MRDIRRAIRASIAAILVSASLLTSWLALPQSAAACSCFSGDLKQWAAVPDSVIFSGTVHPADALNLDVVVDRWFHGARAARIVHLDPAGFGPHGESCQAAPPPPGSRWLFATGRTPGRDLVQLGLCSLRVDLSTVDGRAVLAAAEKRFPAVTLPPIATDFSIVDPLPARPAPTTAALTDVPPSDSGGIVPIVSLVALVSAAAALGALLLVTRRRRGAPD